MVLDASLGIDLNVTPFHKTDDTPINDDINQMSLENKKLREMLTIVWDKNNTLQNHVNKLMQDNDVLLTNPNKRKFGECEEGNASGSTENLHDCGSLKRPNEGITRVYRRIDDPSDKNMVVKDGYHWRKYGQKVTRDNPSPRAYYKCSFAPFCPVKKKVQRSVEDAHLLVVIYEGEHNHESLEKEPEIHTRKRCLNSSMEMLKFDESLVEQMANSLKRNPDFIEDLADAISSNILEYDLL